VKSNAYLHLVSFILSLKMSTFTDFMLSGDEHLPNETGDKDDQNQTGYEHVQNETGDEDDQNETGNDDDPNNDLSGQEHTHHLKDIRERTFEEQQKEQEVIEKIAESAINAGETAKLRLRTR